MFSPRQQENGADTPDQAPASTPRGSLLSGISKLLWTPSQDGEGAGTPGGPPPALEAAGSSFMTQSPRRTLPNEPTSPAGAAAVPPLNTAGASAAAANEPLSPRSSGLLDTLFSPIFTIFGNRGEGGAAGTPPTAEQQQAMAQAQAQAAAAAAAAAEAEAQATARAQAAAAQAAAQAQAAARQQQQAPDDDDPEEFDPFAFIRTLPPNPPPLTRPICLPRKTRGTPPISLVLDLDETLLHSSIVALPTYDIVFPVHFNAVNYQVYVRKRPHMDFFMERVSKLFEITVFTASQKVYADKLLSIIDPQRKWIKHRVFRDSCVLVEGERTPPRPLAHTPLVGHSRA